MESAGEIRIALVSHVVNTSCRCLAKFLPLRAILHVVAVNRVIFRRGRPQWTKYVFQRRRRGIIRISQLQLNYRTLVV